MWRLGSPAPSGASPWRRVNQAPARQLATRQGRRSGKGGQARAGLVSGLYDDAAADLDVDVQVVPVQQ